MSHYGMFYNDKKQELMGTDGLFVCDGRLGRTSTIMEAKKQARMFDKNEKVLAHGTSKLMVTHNKQSMTDLVSYLGSTQLPHKFLGTDHAI